MAPTLRVPSVCAGTLLSQLLGARLVTELLSQGTGVLELSFLPTADCADRAAAAAAAEWVEGSGGPMGLLAGGPSPCPWAALPRLSQWESWAPG